MITERLTGEASLSQELEGLSVSKRLVRTVSQKLRKKNHKCEAEDEENARGVSMRCLTLYGRGGGCKVGADTTDEFGRRSNASEEGKGGYKTICGDETGVDCFSYGVKDKFWKRNNRKELLGFEESIGNSRMHAFLPDDILEMCLVRLPMTSLMNARLVCKKWKSMTTTPRFMQMRRDGSHQSPWLFLFGAVKNGFCSGEIHAFDVSLNQWHKIDSGILKGRFLFSVTSVRDDVYIVGGCSSLTNFGKIDRSSFKVHRGAYIFSPVNKSWRKIASMKHARSAPVLGISELGSDCSIVRQERRFYKSRVGGVSDVYEDPHRLSVRRQYFEEPDKKPCKFVKQKNGQSENKRFVVIAVGGSGFWDEPLDSGEIYDTVSNKWVEIQRLPVDFGVVCSGVVCNGLFYVYSETDRLAGYDIEKGFWIGIQTTSPFPPRVHEYYPKLVSCNGQLYMLSVSWCEGDGQIGRKNKAVRKLWELDLMYLTWSEVTVHPDAPMDWNAAFVADQNLIFGVEMFKIFGQVLDFLTVCNVSDVETKWNHVSKNHVAHEMDACSCLTKTMAVLHM